MSGFGEDMARKLNPPAAAGEKMKQGNSVGVTGRQAKELCVIPFAMQRRDQGENMLRRDTRTHGLTES